MLFHSDAYEADDVFEVLGDLARDLRSHHVYNVLIGKINMLHNEVLEGVFPVYTYPSLHLIFKSEDGHMMSQVIKAAHKKELVHLVFQTSQRLSKDYDDKIYYKIMSGEKQELPPSVQSTNAESDVEGVENEQEFIATDDL